MALVVIIVGGAAWLVAAAACLVVALGGAQLVTAILPPLAISDPAVERAAAGLGIACLVVGGAHLVVGIGARGAQRWAWSATALLGGVMAAGFVALAAAALTSAAAGTMGTLTGIGAAVGTALVASAYGLATLGAVDRLRSGSAV